MRFDTILPGLSRYRPILQPWEPAMAAGDFQLVARVAEEVGFDAVSVPEHVVVPRDAAADMGGHWPHALTAMAFVAGATTRLRVNSCVIVLPYHHPVVLAKAISTLDVLSGGRVTVTFGVGHLRGEFDALGVPFEGRGRWVDEQLDAMVELWTAERPSFAGARVRFEDVVFEPRPVQRPHPPVWLGGQADATLRRVARVGDGWWPWRVPHAELGGRIERLRALAAAAGRERTPDVMSSVSPVRVGEDHRPLDGAGTGAPAPVRGAAELVDAVGRLAEVGVTWTGLPSPPTRTLDEHLDHLRWLGEEVLPHCR